ncbi:hypothetical protein BH23DEI1_BH23DEI1_17420 [soil metagenome]
MTGPEGRATRWWLEGGDEQCDTCLAFHHVEMEVRCEACDGPYCRSCIAEVRRERLLLLCASCAADEADS